MRYHYKKQHLYLKMYGKAYECNHPVYNKCTLYRIKDKGLAVIQQRYDPITKHTWWGEVDDDMIDALYLNTNFIKVFNDRASKPTNGLYPTITIRQLMWAMKMKPLPKEQWETAFDRRDI